MKNFVLIICLLTIITSCGCITLPKMDNHIPETSQPKPSIPEIDFTKPDAPDISANDKNNNTDSNINIELPKRKYLVSAVNQLRIRSAPNNSSSVLGYLDKNDAALYVDETKEYYKTIYKEQIAYIHKGYCSIMEIHAENESIEKAIDLGCTLLGYPYVWGSQRYHWGNGKLNTEFEPGKFDCSALVQYIYYISNGAILDLTTRTQVYNGTEVKKHELTRGDLIFFTNSSRKNLTGIERIGHVGIYFGNNYILHTASDHAVIEPISNTRWSYYITARRVV